MAILINDTSPRTQYTATASQTVFTIPFEFFSNADLVVYQNTTLKTLTTHYTATGAGVTGGGTLTLVTGATAGDVITIIRDIPVKRVTDFPTSGPFNVEALNSDLDRLTAMVREREDQVSRVISLAQTDTAVNLYLPTAAERASKVMGFDSTGNVIIAQELGQYRGNWASGTAYVLRDIIKDTSNANIYICVAAHTSTGSQPISSNANSASWALLVDAATASSASSSASASASAASSSASAASSSASSASSSASAASGSASSAASAQSAAESARDATLAAYDSFDDRYLGSKTSDPSVDNDGNALVGGSLYFDSVNGIMKIYTGSAWVAAYVSSSGFVSQTSATGAAQLPASTTANRPSPVTGHLRFNTTLTAFEGYNGTAWSPVGGGATGGSTDQIFYLNSQTVTANYSIPAGQNAGTFGPISVDASATVTVPSGSTWSIV